MADNYPAAAAKHLVDSRALLAAARWDGAAYLAGYGVECAVKSIIQAERGDPHGHLPRITAQAARLAALPGARTAQYVKRLEVHSLPLGRPNGWDPALRYEDSGSVDEAAARAWTAEAERLYTEIVFPMKRDGVI